MIIKKYLLIILLILSAIIQSRACSEAGKPPAPGFNSIPAFGCTGQVVQYGVATSGSVDSVLYYWDWGDGVYDTFVPPGGYGGQHVFSLAGIYNISLIKQNGNGKDSTYDTLTIYDPPIADFAIGGIECIGGDVLFTDLSSPGLGAAVIKWDWSFGDGVIDTVSNPLHSYGDMLNYKVDLIVTNADGCTSSHSDTTIPAVVDTNIVNLNFTESCPCNTILFNATGTSGTFDWTLGDGTSLSGSSVSHKYSLPISYTITLSGRDMNNCLYTESAVLDICKGDTLLTASKANDNWFFYTEAGVAFGSGTATAVTTGKMSRGTPGGEGGGSTVSDPKTGQLLFYTDGQNVWDATDTIMPNGDSLRGHDNTSQTVLVMPFPGNRDQYYVFTTVGLSSGGSPWLGMVYYSVVDMTLNGGKGDIIPGMKNILLTTHDGTESLSGAIKKLATCSTSAEYWLIIPAHYVDSTAIVQYEIFLLNSSGISLWGINSFVNPGTDFFNFNRLGNSAFSNNGNKYVKSVLNNGFLMYDFDKENGILSNQRLISHPLGSASNQYTYGLCFAPNDRYLYTTIGGAIGSLPRITQYDITKFDITGTVNVLNTSNLTPASIWLGNDNKIYFSKAGSGSLGVINNPNIAGAGAGSNMTGLNLAGKGSGYGLQNIVPLQNVIDSIPLFANFVIDTPTCPTYTVQFSDTSCDFEADSVSTTWIYGDGTSDSYNVLTYPNHTYPGPGSYNVQLIISKDCYLTDTARATIILDTIPSVSFLSDTVCEGLVSSLTASVKNIDITSIVYNWDNGITDTTANINYVFPASGSYLVTLSVTDTVGCMYVYSDNVWVMELPIVSVGNDTLLCEGQSGNLNAQLIAGQNSGTTTYTWSPVVGVANVNSSNTTVTPVQTDVYTVAVSNLCGADSSSLTITIDPCTYYIPNAFSPNNDGINDEFFVQGSGFKTFNLKVYDRWGNRVFDTKDQNEQWDGTLNNVLLQEGVFVYRFTASFEDGREIEESGNITLIR